MNIIDSLVVTLGLDVTKFSRGQKQAGQDLRKTQEESNSAAKAIEASGKQAAEFFGKLRNQALMLFGVLTAGRGIKQLVSNITDTDAATQRLAHNLGMSTELLSEWQGAAERTGGSAQATGSSFDNLTQEFQKISMGMGSAVIPYFRALGIQIADANGKIRPLNDILLDLADRFSKMDPRQALAFGRAIGLDDGTINLLEKGRAGVQALLDAQKRLGVATDEDGVRAQQLQNSLLDIQQAATSLVRTIINDLSPTIISVLQGMDSWIQKNREWLASKITEYVIQFKDQAVELFEYLKTVDWGPIIEQGKQLGEQLLQLVSTINSIVQATTGWQTAIEALLGIWVVGKFAPVVGVLGTILQTITGITGGIGGLIALVSSPAFLAAGAALYALWPKAAAGQEELDAEKKQAEQNLKDHPETAVPDSDGKNRADPFMEWWRSTMPKALGGAGKTTKEQDERSKRAIGYFTSQGWSPEQAAGIVGNIQQESSFDEKAGAGTAHQGLAQWSAARQKDIEQHFGKALMSMNYDEQLAAIQYELTQGNYKGVGDKLRGTTNAQDAAQVIDERYESPGNYSYENARRGANAVARLQAYQGGLNTGASAAAASRAPVSNSTSTSTSEVNVNGPITVSTQATDAKGVAAGLMGAIRNQGMVAQANAGLN